MLFRPKVIDIIHLTFFVRSPLPELTLLSDDQLVLDELTRLPLPRLLERVTERI
jgi:hypothetical protein